MRFGSFSFKLPSFMILYEKRLANETETVRMGSKDYVCSAGPYADIVVTVG